MISRLLLSCFALSGTLAAQSLTFLQMSDPQFGMYTENKSFAQETANFEFAVATANRLQPAFVVITGDLINKPGDRAQTAEYHRIVRKLDRRIPVYNVAGNHDVDNDPTPESLAYYRKHFGRDYYSFRAGGVVGIVLNSSLLKSPAKVPGEAENMEAWFRAELARAKREGARQILIFQHISLFLKTADEPDQYFNIPLETRKRYLQLLHENGIRHVFAGHYHRNEEGKDGDLEMITSGPVGKPLGGAKSGFRVITIDADALTHKYFEFGDLPEK
jgi:serine/threonine-protein phosphatase CPPED1